MQSYLLPIHFKILEEKHEVNSFTLNTFVEAYKEIFEELFDVKIEIHIGLPEEGCWKAKLVVIGAFASFIGIDNLSIIARGKDSKDFFLAANKHITEFLTKKAENTSEEFPRKCLEQKNKIFHQFQKDSCITAFDLDDIPPIPRSEFNLYIKELPMENTLYCGETKITVHSTSWKGRKRSWKGIIDIIDDTERAFDFDKELTGKFWESVALDTLSVTTQDEMIVQLIQRPNNNKPIYRVIRVLSYNGKEIDLALSPENISKITSGNIEDPNDERGDNAQMNFFNILENNG
jgi:hypothetical protein